MSRWCVSSSCFITSESARPRFCSVICALKASIPPYWMYRGGLPPMMMSGRYFSASSSHVVTWARMSFTDQVSMAPGSVSCESDKPRYDSLRAAHDLSSCCRSLCLSIFQVLPSLFSCTMARLFSFVAVQIFYTPVIGGNKSLRSAREIIKETAFLLIYGTAIFQHREHSIAHSPE